MDEFLKANRLSWDERVQIHLDDRTGFYNVQAFREGRTRLTSIEESEIGDVTGLRLLHLQCHFGLDTLVLAWLGADATGLDFSENAIAAARALARETGLDAAFVEGNVYDAPAVVEGPFDIVYSSWGAIIWLPSLDRWARIVADPLTPGGFFYLADSHPTISMLEEENGQLAFRYGWRTAPERPDAFDEGKTYTGDQTKPENVRTYEWAHPFSRIIGALMGAGLRLDMLNEHETLPWPAFPMMVPADDGMFRLPDHHPALPLAFSLKASKPLK